MAGKSNTSATFFAQKKLLGKANTSLMKTDGEELIGSNIQAASSQVFGQVLPDNPAKTLYLLQSASNGGPATVEYIHFQIDVITGSTYDANSTNPDGGSGADSGESGQSSGPHSYKFRFRSDYESNSSNPKKGNESFSNSRILHETLGKVQLIPPFFSQTAPNPYIVEIFKDNGSGGIGDKIDLTDNIDWNVDYYNGILFIQDYDSSKIPAHGKAFAYVGDFANSGFFESSLSGSLQKLTDGSSYLAAGSGITITSASNGQVTIASSGGGGSVAGSDTQIQFNDDGSFGGDSGLVFNKTTNTLTTDNLSGSLTKLSDGTSYLIAGDNVTITSASNGQITISSTATGGGSAGPREKESYSVSSLVASGSVFNTSTVSYSDAGNDPDLIDIFLNGQLLISGTNAQVGLGAVDYFVHSDDQLKFGFDLNPDDIVSVIVSATGSGEAGTPGGSDTQVQFNDGGTLNGDSGLIFNKTTNTLTTNNLSGSLTRLSDGTSYILSNGSISVTTQSNGSIVLSAANSIFNEYIGEANGSNTRFTLAKAPTANKNISVFVNGQLQMPATNITGAPFQDYSVTGSVIFFVTASLPPDGSLLMANYTTNQSIT
jgi:hypothetical protein